MCRWRATQCWKVFNESYNFSWDFISIRRLHTKLWASKGVEVSTLGILRFPFGSFGTKWHLGAGLVAMHRIKGKVVASPKFRLWWVLWVCVCPWFVRAPKCSNYALTNLLFGLCMFVWIIDLLVNILNPHLGTSARHSILEMLRIRECTPTPSPFAVFTFGLVVESIKELGVRQ